MTIDPPRDLLDLLADALSRGGLLLRGTVHFAPGEPAPEIAAGKQARSLVLVGNGGGSFWPCFSRWLEDQPDGLTDPLDNWSKQVIGAVAETFGLRAVFPSDRPWQPFQQWAMRAEGLRASPLGILMHPEYGLWHAYRGALLSDVDLPKHGVEKGIHLCDACDWKPCLNSCPAGAIQEGGFNSAACGEHVAGPEGGSCRDKGCIARNHCPHDRYRYSSAQQAFHLKAFLRGPFGAPQKKL